MTEIWKGAAKPLAPHELSDAAKTLGCDVAAIQAVWEVEASGRTYNSDGSLPRRFEPHKMPGATTTWRDSMNLSTRQREAAFLAAYAEYPDSALEATSWGGPQIMGFNHGVAGFLSAADMVVAMADSESAQLDAFVSFVQANEIDSAIRAHDWHTFARVYNGSGQVEEYARRMASAYRRATGSKSAQVLRQGDSGDGVVKLQRALGIEEDGHFGPETAAAVRRFQQERGLAVDGLVGHKTWTAITSRPATPVAVAPKQEDTIDKYAEQAAKIGGTVTVIAGALEAIEKAVPVSSQPIVYATLCAVALIAVFGYIVKKVRA